MESSDFVTLLDREDMALKALAQSRPKPSGYHYLERIRIV